MNKRLTGNLTPEEKKELQDILKYSPVIEKLRKILEEDLDACKRSRRSLKSVLTQNYSEYQADRNATERAYAKVLELLKA
jgi:hypothetical protein